MFIQALLTVIASILLGIPGGLLIGLIGALDPRSFVGADLTGLGAYIIIGGLFVAAACFICALVGRLVAALLARISWAPLAIFGAAALNLLLAVVYLVVVRRSRPVHPRDEHDRDDHQ